MINKKKKRHRHKWQQDQDCHACGAYTEYCIREKQGEMCGAVRLCDAEGKCKVEQ